MPFGDYVDLASIHVPSEGANAAPAAWGLGVNADMGFLAEPPLCAAACTGQTLTTAVNTDIDFDLAVLDADNMHNGSTQFEIPGDGIYLVSLLIEFDAHATNIRQVGMEVNGTPNVFGDQQFTNSGTFTTVLHCSALYTLTEADVLTFQAYQNRGGNLDITGAVTIKWESFR